MKIKDQSKGNITLFTVFTNFLGRKSKQYIEKFTTVQFSISNV